MILLLSCEVVLENRAAKCCATWEIDIMNLSDKTSHPDNVTYRIKILAFIENISVC
jgi:hypothetical protein